MTLIDVYTACWRHIARNERTDASTSAADDVITSSPQN